MMHMTYIQYYYYYYYIYNTVGALLAELFIIQTTEVTVVLEFS